MDMEYEPPPDEAYGRVTNPERYRAVVEAAHELVASLGADFGASMETGIAATDFPGWHEPEAPTTRITPARGMRITVMYTDFPGVVLGVGELNRYGPYDAFPSCGCDACDEPIADLIDHMGELVAAVVDGSYREGLTKTKLWRAWGGGRSWRTLRRGEWKKYGELGELSWEPWPRRGDS